VGNSPPASRTRRHAAVRASAPGTPYLQSASSAVNFGIHFESNLGLHCVVSFSMSDFSKESISSAHASCDLVDPIITPAVAAAAPTVILLTTSSKISLLCMSSGGCGVADDGALEQVCAADDGANAEPLDRAVATMARQKVLV